MSWTEAVGATVRNDTPTVQQLCTALNCSTNQAEAIRKAAGQ